MRLFRLHVLGVLVASTFANAAPIAEGMLAASIFASAVSIDPREYEHGHSAIQPGPDETRSTLLRRAEGSEEDPSAAKRKAIMQVSDLLHKLVKFGEWDMRKLPRKAKHFQRLFRWEDERLRLGGAPEPGSLGLHRHVDDRILKRIVTTRDPEPYLQAFDRALAGRPERARRARDLRNAVAAVQRLVRARGPDRARARTDVHGELVAARHHFRRTANRVRHDLRDHAREEAQRTRDEAELKRAGKRVQILELVHAALEADGEPPPHRPGRAPRRPPAAAA